MKILRSLALAVALAAPLAVLSPASAQDIVDVASKDAQFATLVTAVKAAGLVDALKGKGPLTVFAPTDEAFKKLPAGTLDSLLKPENKERLAAILKYHVIAGKYDGTRLSKASAKSFAIPTLEGSTVEFDITKGVKVGSAMVTKPDITASNGVIHVIDTVIVPAKIKRQMAIEAAKAKAVELGKKAVELGKKAVEATKEAAGKAVEKAKELAKPAETKPAEATAPAKKP